jgi:ribosome-binding factor A
MTTTPVSPRSERIGQAIVQQLSHLMLTEVQDKSLRFVQLTKVIVTKDMGSAKVYFLVADPNKSKEKILKKLNKAASWFRFELAKRMELRVTPELKFYFDERHEKAQQILTLLNKI